MMTKILLWIAKFNGTLYKLDDKGDIIIRNNRLTNLYIKPEYRGQGYGKELLGKAEIIIKRQGYDVCYGFCRKGLLQYYKKQGWYQTKQLSDSLFRIEKRL